VKKKKGDLSIGDAQEPSESPSCALRSSRDGSVRHTPGPWEWCENSRGKYLATPDRGHLTVMDCVRLGMSGAQPRFAVWEGPQRERMGGIMFSASELTLADHPDARLIAAAPELLAALEELVQRCDGPEGVRADGSNIQTIAAHALLAKVQPDCGCGPVHRWDCAAIAAARGEAA
jgi:hypothetical protein